MAISTTPELLAELSDYWYKEPDGNLFKLFDTVNLPLQFVSKEADKVEVWREIAEAEGTTLNLIGQGEKAYRPSKNDDVYRFLIYIKYLMARAQGTAPSIVHIASAALRNNQGFKITKLRNRHVAIQIPYSKMKDLPTQRFILENLQRLLALGIWLDYIILPIQSDTTEYLGSAMTSHYHHKLDFGKTVWWLGYNKDFPQQEYDGTAMTIQASLHFSLAN